MATEMKVDGFACTGYEASLEDYLNEELNRTDAERVRRHAESCERCSAGLERAMASTRLLRAAEPSRDPGPAFPRMVMARIREAEQQRTAERSGFWSPLVSLGWRFAASATLAVGILLTYGVGASRHPQPSVAVARPMESTDLFAPYPAAPPANGDEVLMMVAETNHGKY
jgi:anti-sigma factor RsiW